jgi:histidinol-phosphate aminotransferase
MMARLPFIFNRMDERVALSLLNTPDLVGDRVASLTAACKVLAWELKRLPGVQVLPSQANFLLFQTGEQPETLMQKLADRGVLVRNMSGYSELAGFLRVNAGAPEENKAFLNALEDALYARERTA